MNTKCKTIVLIAFLFITSLSFSHPGGHGEKSNLKTWMIDNDQSVTASFLLKKNEEVYLEKKNGEIVHVDFTQLSQKDQLYVSKKTKMIDEVNAQVNLTHPEHESSSNSVMITIAIVLMIGFILSILFVKKKSLKSLVASMLLLMIVYACSSEDDDVMDVEVVLTEVSANIPATMDLAFAPYDNVSTFSDASYYYVESNGIPDHQMMVNITAWIAQVPVPHDYTGDNAWPIPLNPAYADSPISIEGDFQRGAIAIASNGIPIFNPINASGLISNEIGELDDFGGHSGRGDDYHYHTAPLHLESTSGTLPIAFGLDGFAVYGSTEPDGTAMESLDSYHGHEDGEGSYHYHGTESYPYMIGSMRGEVVLEGESPQNQVTPQSMAFPPRGGNPYGINSDDLLITNLEEKTSGNGYLLTYTSDGKEGSVDYSWDDNDLFTFIFNDIDGTTTTETWQR